MFTHFSKTTSALAISTFAGLCALNLLVWQQAWLGVLIGIIYLGMCSAMAGELIEPAWRTDAAGLSFLLGSLAVFSLIAVIGAGAIFFLQLTPLVFLLMLISIPIGLTVPFFLKPQPGKLAQLRHKLTGLFSRRQSVENQTSRRLAILYLLASAACFVLLYAGQTTSSIQTPWQTVPGIFFGCYGIATLILIWYCLRTPVTRLSFFLLGLHALLSTGVALLVFRIGFGFDPFIHQATERLIAQTGTLNPKPFYYLGQYGLVLFLHWLTLLPIDLIDRALVPVLFAIFVPASAALILRRWFTGNIALLLGLATLAMPYDKFIMTAPQNLANLWFILTVLFSLLFLVNALPFWFLALLGLATAAIHPLAGVPLLITLVIAWLFTKTQSDKLLPRLALISTAVLACVLMPILLLISGATIQFNPPQLDWSALRPMFKSDLALDLVYLFNSLKFPLAGGLIAAGIWVLKKTKVKAKKTPSPTPWLIAGAVLAANFFLVRYGLGFPALQEHDRLDFTLRLGTLAFLTLWPIGLFAAGKLLTVLFEGDGWTRAFLTLLLGGALASSFYLSYPRLDSYGPAKFISLSSSDLKAVHLIEEHAAPDHIVLANQMIGVAAIKEYGFKKYYNNQFYYSMPSGTPHRLYDLYLNMVEQAPSRVTMLRAMDEAGVDEAYFVLNRYWRGSEKIAAAAATQADTVYAVDNDEVTVFAYRRSEAVVSDTSPASTGAPK